MKIPEELIDHLEHEIKIGNVDKKVQNLISVLAEQNLKYKEVIDKAIKELNDYLNINTVIRDELLDILKEVE